jgi:hypothetical protein
VFGAQEAVYVFPDGRQLVALSGPGPYYAVKDISGAHLYYVHEEVVDYAASIMQQILSQRGDYR